MTDCKVCDNIFTRTYIDPIFVRANWEIDEEGNKIDSKNNPDRAMTSSEFVEGLIRVAHGKFNSSMGGTVLTMCLRKLVYQHILNSSATQTWKGKTFSQRNVAEIFNCREGIHGQTGCVYNKNRFALTDSSVADYLNMLSIFFMIALIALILIFPKYINIPLIQIT